MIARLRASLGATIEVLKLRVRGVEFPPVAPDLRDQGLFIGTSNSAGQGWAWARAFESARPGMRAVSARFGGEHQDASFAFSVDQPVFSHYAAHSRRWQRRQFEAVSAYRGALVESGDAIFARLSGGDPVAQVRALQEAGVAVGLLFHGSDIRAPDPHMRVEPHSHFAADETFAHAFRELTDRNRELIAELQIPVFVSTPDLLDEVPGGTWLPVVVDVSRWATERPPLQDERVPLRIVHIPSSSMVKGTELVDPLLRDLASEGGVDYRTLTAVPHAEMPAAYGSADVVIDQFRVGNYGVAACEAMAAGRIVVSHVSERVRERTRELTGEPLPIIEATPETLREVLSAIRTDPQRYLELASRGPGFVQRHHDGRRSGAVLGDWLMPL
ncbi:glycosyltransferase [Microbacterium sp.]|uniref:glycosyltransferase n=1 Tax=Microbacterium sp. TaxID=51671 RepID=UPI003A9321F3